MNQRKSKRKAKTREPSYREHKSATIFEALSVEDQVYILDKEIKEKEAKLTDLKNEDYKYSKFLSKVKTPLLMDENSTKYDPEGLKAIQENEYLRRRVEELELEMEEKEVAQNRKNALLQPGETFESLAKKRKDHNMKTKAIILVKRKYDVSNFFLKNEF